MAEPLDEPVGDLAADTTLASGRRGHKPRDRTLNIAAMR